MKKYAIQYQKEDFSFTEFIVEAENKRDAVKKALDIKTNDPIYETIKELKMQGMKGSGRRLLLANTKEIQSKKYKN